MDEYRPRRLLASEQFIGMCSSPSPSPSFVAGDEFHEDDFLFSASPAASSDAPPDGSGSPSRVPQGHLGLLAALHEGDKRLLVRPPSPSAFLPLGTRNLVRSRRICLPSFGHASVATGLPSTLHSAREHGCDARVEMRYAWLQRRRLHGYDRKGSGKTSLLSIQRGSVSKHEKSTKSVMPNRREGCPSSTSSTEKGG